MARRIKPVLLFTLFCAAFLCHITQSSELKSYHPVFGKYKLFLMISDYLNLADVKSLSLGNTTIQKNLRTKILEFYGTKDFQFLMKPSYLSLYTNCFRTILISHINMLYMVPTVPDKYLTSIIMNSKKFTQIITEQKIQINFLHAYETMYQITSECKLLPISLRDYIICKNKFYHIPLSKNDYKFTFMDKVSNHPPTYHFADNQLEFPNETTHPIRNNIILAPKGWVTNIKIPPFFLIFPTHGCGFVFNPFQDVSFIQWNSETNGTVEFVYRESGYQFTITWNPNKNTNRNPITGQDIDHHFSAQIYSKPAEIIPCFLWL